MLFSSFKIWYFLSYSLLCFLCYFLLYFLWLIFAVIFLLVDIVYYLYVSWFVAIDFIKIVLLVYFSIIHRIPAKKIWIPDMQLQHSQEGTGMLPMETLVILNSKGKVQFVPAPGKFKSACQVGNLGPNSMGPYK